MQTLLKNLFNSIILLGIFLIVILTKIFHKPSVKGTLRYRKINFFATSALYKCIFRIKGVSHAISRLLTICSLPFTLFFFLFVLFPSTSAAIKDRVVAFVDNIAITLSELDEVYTESLKQTPDITKEEVLNTMVNRVLLLREAKKLHLEAPSEEKLLQDYIDLKIRPRIKIKEEDISDFYQKNINDFQGKEFETVREEIEHYLTERELNNLLKKHIDELRKKSYIKIQLNPEDTSCQKPKS
jgi:hypothetical protein